MAPLAKSLTIAITAFTALSAAAPGHGHNHKHKRAEVTVWNTVTEVVWKTVDITTTITEGQQAPPSTFISETVNRATAPPPQPEPVTTTTTTSTTTSTSTSTAEPTSVEPAAPSVDTTVQVQQPTVPIVSVPPQEPAPTSQTTEQAPPPPAETSTSTWAPEPAPTQGSGSGGGGSGPCSASSPCTGQITFYDTATSASAPSSCGTTNDGSSENVIALPVGIMKDGDCGRTVTIKYGGKTSTGTVVDKCMGCDNTSIDLSRHFFSELASFAEGRLHGVEWWLD